MLVVGHEHVVTPNSRCTRRTRRAAARAPWRRGPTAARRAGAAAAVGKGACQRDPLLLAARELVGELARMLGEARHLEHADPTVVVRSTLVDLAAQPGGRTRCSPGRSCSGTGEYSWNTIPKPRFSVGDPVMSEPPTCTRPASGRSKPARIRSAVVFPQPDGPSRQTNSPGDIVRSKPVQGDHRAVRSPQAFQANLDPRSGRAVERWSSDARLSINS